jgi:hypothetical protein
VTGTVGFAADLFPARSLPQSGFVGAASVPNGSGGVRRVKRYCGSAVPVATLVMSDLLGEFGQHVMGVGLLVARVEPRYRCWRGRRHWLCDDVNCR